MRRTVVGLGVVGAVLVGLGVVQLLPGATPLSVPPAQAALVTYDGCGALLADVRADLVETATPYGWGQGYGIRGDFAGAVRTGAVPATPEAAQLDAVGSGATGTNLQEQGVDEPDVTKLADGRIVTVVTGELMVAGTGDAPQLLGRLPLPEGTDPYSVELLVDDDRVLVVSRGVEQRGGQRRGSDDAGPRRPVG